MPFIGRVLFALFWAVAAGFAGLVLGFLLSVWTDRCDPTVHVCDLAPIAGVGLGMIVGTIAALITGWLTFRRSGRATSSGVAQDAHVR